MDLTFHALYINKHYYTISTLQHVLGGYIVHKSCGNFNHIILYLSHFQIRIWRARAPKVRACLPPSDWRSVVKLNGILFPSFTLLTVAYRPSLHTSRHNSSHTHTHTHTRWSNILSLPRRGIFTAHSLLFSAIFTAHIWQH